jgi:hypothetical protein
LTATPTCACSGPCCAFTYQLGRSHAYAARDDAIGGRARAGGLPDRFLFDTIVFDERASGSCRARSARRGVVRTDLLFDMADLSALEALPRSRRPTWPKAWRQRAAGLRAVGART